MHLLSTAPCVNLAAILFPSFPHVLRRIQARSELDRPIKTLGVMLSKEISSLGLLIPVYLEVNSISRWLGSLIRQVVPCAPIA
jgi:hypothetical protein